MKKKQLVGHIEKTIAEAHARGVDTWQIIAVLSKIQRERAERLRDSAGAHEVALMLDRVDLMRTGELDMNDDDSRWLVLGMEQENLGCELTHEPAQLLSAAMSLTYCNDPEGAVQTLAECAREMVDAELSAPLIHRTPELEAEAFAELLVTRVQRELAPPIAA